jgi:hypothetical protein
MGHQCLAPGLAADPYIRTHLATHAGRAGLLASLIDDPGYLIAADPDRLFVALTPLRDPSARMARAVYRDTFDELRSCGEHERAAYLELAARKAGTEDLAERLGGRVEPTHPWRARWAQWQPNAEHFIAGRHDWWVYSLTVPARPSWVTVR